MKVVARTGLLAQIKAALRRSPVVLLTGPRQAGKTTLARQLAGKREGEIFDLEDPETSLRPEVAKQILAPLRGLVVIDEFQRQPELFATIRVLADRRPLPARFLILGSAAPELIKGASESLAGRVAYVDIAGFDLAEVGAAGADRLWERGGFPPAFLARSGSDSYAWRRDLLRTVVERDIPQLGLRVPAEALRRFWTMLAHRHGSVWNAAELARSLGASETAVRHYLDVLSGTFMVRLLPPWFENLGKRLVKSPKVYLRDPGLLHALLGIHTMKELLQHPTVGSSWEGFALDSAIRATNAERESFFYRTHAGAELDLLVVRGDRRWGFEVKRADAPSTTKSMHVALADLHLDHLWIVYPGERALTLAPRISTLPLSHVPDLAARLGRSRSAG